MGEKIISRLFTYLKSKSIPHTRFEKEVGLSNGYLNTQLKRNSDLGEGVIRKIIDNCLDVNPLWLLTGRGSMLNEDKMEQLTSHIDNPLMCNEDIVRIPIVDISVAAGSGFTNPDYIVEEECISMPVSMVKNSRKYLCVRVKGQSMVPSILDGGYLIIRLMERSEWESIRDNYVYVVSDREGRSYVKRLKNRLRQHGFIVCMSDNVDKRNYPNFNLYEEDLNTIWYAEWYFSAKLPNIQETYYRKQGELEDRMDELTAQIQHIQKALAINH